MRTVTGGRVVVAVCLAVMLVGAPVAAAAQSDVVPSAHPHSTESTHPWGLVGLVGLLGLAGLARRRRKPVVADPLAAYPVMRETPRRESRPSPPRGAAPVRVAGTPPRVGPTRIGPGEPTASRRAAAGTVGRSTPRQNRGGHEQVPEIPRPRTAESTAYLPAVPPPPTSVTPDGSIRLAPPPPLHAERLSRPNLDGPAISDATDSSAEPQWPRHDYD
ncbi:IPTL-CTERM sorting domain-containing protein [Saccharomonospora sp. NB11]|jgi:MYXO-CTERM domain-containing protein|uniref:IPTL-CTERM sorting domain-containing protein n=1 Tax=Saccharomonospora sp. NB11 TaxID=1642298 RepID=UPI0018D157A7|nr:IPTL-CTERM sorting domain-containing protein [Saccharomonospora sp. NB11]